MPHTPRRWPVLALVAALLLITFAGLARAALQLGGTTGSHSSLAVAPTPTPASTPTSVPVTPTVTPAPALPGLHIQGTAFVDATGKTVTLIGATRQSLEYLCKGDGHFAPTDFQAMRAWGMNAVRITLSSEFWANAGGDCPTYHQTVTQAVYAAETAGLYVMLDLQWDAPFDTAYDRAHGGVQCPLPDTGKDVQMWRDLGTIYQHDQAVIFDLFGEPHDVTWDQWLNGGTISWGCYIINSGAAPQEPGSYQAIGMRDLVAAIRAVTPATIFIVDGLSWGYDLSGIDAAHLIQDPNVVYGTHPFDYASKAPGLWDHDFGNFAAQHPVIAGEFGAYDCGTGYIQQAISYFEQHKMSRLAGAWNVGTCSGPSLLSDWSGTPVAPYGTFIQQAMLTAARKNG